jgi:ABC-type maltose transport system permease subunit
MQRPAETHFPALAGESVSERGPLSMLPALGCFIFAQRHLVGGFTGAVKG